jgi:hypothetical protein
VYISGHRFRQIVLQCEFADAKSTTVQFSANNHLEVKSRALQYPSRLAPDYVAVHCYFVSSARKNVVSDDAPTLAYAINYAL